MFATAFTTTNSWQGFYWFKSFQLEKFKIKLGVTWAMSKLFKYLMAYLIVIENNYNIYFNKCYHNFFIIIQNMIIVDISLLIKNNPI